MEVDVAVPEADMILFQTWNSQTKSIKKIFGSPALILTFWGRFGDGTPFGQWSRAEQHCMEPRRQPRVWQDNEAMD